VEERWKELAPRSELRRSDIDRVWCTADRSVLEGYTGVTAFYNETVMKLEMT